MTGVERFNQRFNAPPFVELFDVPRTTNNTLRRYIDEHEEKEGGPQHHPAIKRRADPLAAAIVPRVRGKTRSTLLGVTDNEEEDVLDYNVLNELDGKLVAPYGDLHQFCSERKLPCSCRALDMLLDIPGTPGMQKIFINWAWERMIHLGVPHPNEALCLGVANLLAFRWMHFFQERYWLGQRPTEYELRQAMMTPADFDLHRIYTIIHRFDDDYNDRLGELAGEATFEAHALREALAAAFDLMKEAKEEFDKVTISYSFGHLAAITSRYRNECTGGSNPFGIRSTLAMNRTGKGCLGIIFH
jgi:hypothetical protein